MKIYSLSMVLMNEIVKLFLEDKKKKKILINPFTITLPSYTFEHGNPPPRSRIR